MKTKISIKNILLFTVAGLIDIFEELHDPGDIYSNYFQNYYGFVPGNWKKQNLVSALSNCYRKNLISKKNNRLNLTPIGRSQLYSKYPHLFWKTESWNGQWYFVMFDFAEIRRNKRNVFRLRLTQAGFIFIQKSVWVSPSSKSHRIISSWIKQEKIFKEVLLIKTTKLPLQYQKILVDQIWNLNKIHSYLQTVHKKLKLISKKIHYYKNLKLLEAEFLKTYNELTDSLLKFPHLPKQFYPKNWPYKKVILESNKLKLFFAKQIKK